MRHFPFKTVFKYILEWYHLDGLLYYLMWFKIHVMLFLFTFYRKFCKNTVARQQGKRTEFLSPCFWLTSLQVEEAAFANGSGLSYFLQLFTMYFNISFSLVQRRKRTHKKDDRREFCTSLWSNTGNTLPSNWIPICIITLARTISLSSLLEFNSSEVLSL